MTVAADLEPDTAFSFHGNWRAFMPIALTNALLTLATLGVYRFWATTRERRYFWSQTRFIDDRLEWTGTGLELFFGFLIALGLIILPVIALNLFIQGLIIQNRPGLVLLLTMLLYIFILYMVGIAIFRGLRYRLSRTYWHGIHGGTDTQGWRYGLEYLWRTVVGFLPAGLLIPWSMTSLWHKRWSEMSFGPHRFVSTPEWSRLMGRFVLAYLAPIGILVGIGILIAMTAGAMMASGAGSMDNPGPAFIAIIVLAVFAFYIAWPLAALVYYSAFMREVVGTLSLSTLEFQFNARTKDWIKLFLGNAALFIGAFAVAAIPLSALGLFAQFGKLQPGESAFAHNPFAAIAFFVILAIPIALISPLMRYRNWRFFITHLEATGEINLTSLTQSQTRELKQGEGLLDAFDMGAM